ncbi:MAG: hypothetical protein E7546_05560 [Ruminococcaceae bacterium]|nr:hypothetical protein [Oscillospiraceae bacterium]
MLKKLFEPFERAENERALEQVRAMLSSRAIPHGLYIEGQSAQECDGLAELLARAQMCSCEEILSGECESCRLLTEGELHPDMVDITGEGKTGAISVERVRDMRIEAQLSPTKGGRRVFILHDCDTMNSSAQNAFLKLLEEPPERVAFILTCRQGMNLLETIRSRAAAVRIEGGKDEEEISDELRELADKFAAALCAPNEWDAVRLTAYFIRDRKENAAAQKELLQFTGLLRAIIRDAMIISAGAQSVLSDISDGAKKMSAIPSERLEEMLCELDETDRAVRLYVSLTLVTTGMVSRLRSIRNKK